MEILNVNNLSEAFICDEEVYLHKSNGINNAFRKQDIINDWTSDPNPNKDLHLGS